MTTPSHWERRGGRSRVPLEPELLGPPAAQAEGYDTSEPASMAAINMPIGIDFEFMSPSMENEHPGMHSMLTYQQLRCVPASILRCANPFWIFKPSGSPGREARGAAQFTPDGFQLAAHVREVI